MTRSVPHDGITGPQGEPVVVRRSARRHRTVSATRRDGAIEVAIPATFTARQEREWVRRMVERLGRQEARTQRGDEDLVRIARELSRDHFEDRARPTRVTWSSRQHTRWGSCTPADGTIRISERVRAMPEWVLRYVLVHELAHLFEGDHGPAFQALVARYPHSERARGFLDGVSFAEHQERGGASPGPGPDPASEHDPEQDVDQPSAGSEPGVLW